MTCSKKQAANTKAANPDCPGVKSVLDATCGIESAILMNGHQAYFKCMLSAPATQRDTTFRISVFRRMFQPGRYNYQEGVSSYYIRNFWNSLRMRLTATNHE